MINYVLDASAILALLQDEKGSDQVKAIFHESVITAVNAIEVMTKLVQIGVNDQEINFLYNHLIKPIIVPINEELVIQTAKIVNTTKPYGLSLGDRICLSYGIKYNKKIVTADKEWSNIKIDQEIIQIR